MEKKQMLSLIKLLNGNPNIYICGPKYDDRHLRVYAHGGLLCEIPTESQAKIVLLDNNYLKNFLPENPSLFAAAQGLFDNEEKELFLRDHLEDLLLCFNRKFSSQWGENVERNQQTVISRAYTSFLQHNGTVVCDFQSSIPTAWLSDGMSRPTFDMVIFSPNENTFTLVELKCTASSCGGKTGLQKHAEDMLKCVTNPKTNGLYKKELLRRLSYMCEYGLLQNCPAGLECLRPEALNLRAAFLFTAGKGLENREKAAALCKKYIPKDDLDKFRYCFAESPQAVELSCMEKWNFSDHH